MSTFKKHKLKFEKNITIPEFSTNFHPGDNFYLYINDKWLKKTNIPNYESSYSVNEEISEIIEKDLFLLLDISSKFAMKGDKVLGFDSKLKDTIGRFVLSSLRKGVQKNSIRTLKNGIQSFRCIRNIDDIGEILGYFCRNKINTVLLSDVQLERTDHNESIYTLILLNGSLGMPDVSYYNATAPGKLKTLMSYIQMIKKICKELDIEDISDIVTTESYFSAYTKVDSHETFLIKGNELQNKYKQFPWESFFLSYGIDGWKHITFRIESDGWIKILEKSMTTIGFDQWKNMFILHLILHALPLLPPPFDDIDYKFYGEILKGQKKKISQDYLTLYLSKQYLSRPLSILYKKYFLKDSLKKNATKFIEKIRHSAIDQIHTNTWMQQKTKNEAKEKVRKMVLSIGWPDYYPHFILPELQTDNLLENIYLLSEYSSNEEIGLLNKKSIPGKTWNEPAFTVNAYYYNEINEFIIPAGSLFYPFFNGKSKGWDYGGLGAVIGHEMIHAFDDGGRSYDKYGYSKNWWLTKDNTRFHNLSKELIEFYNKSKVLTGKINGTLTLNENLADLGGLSVALEALKKEIKNNKYELQQFFISYAVSWRTKEQKRKTLQNLIIDKHSPAEFRVNNIVCHFQEWYDAFDIRVENDMYIPPEERIKIY